MIMDLVMVDVSIGNGPLDELRARRDVKRLVAGELDPGKERQVGLSMRRGRSAPWITRIGRMSALIASGSRVR
jgi:hypothetical protein